MNMNKTTPWFDPKKGNFSYCITVGEKVTVKIYLKRSFKERYLLESDYQAYGVVVAVKRVNLVIEESIDSTLPGKRWLVRRVRVRRDRDAIA